MDSNIIKVGRERYNSDGFASENILTEAGLLKADELTSVTIFLNDAMRSDSPFMWLNGGQMGFQSDELEGDGQFYWQVMGAIKEHDEIVGSPYSGTDKPGYNLQPFIIHLSSTWIKEGWLITFKDGYIGRVSSAPIPKTNYVVYEITPYGTNPSSYCPLSNLTTGNLVREGVYVVPSRLDAGTESNSQTPAKRTNQISKVRFAHRITGNIANKQVVWWEFPKSWGGKEGTKYWVDYDYMMTTAQNERKLERFLFEQSTYNRDAQGRFLPNFRDRRSGGEPIMSGASIKEQIYAQGNFASYGNRFTVSYWERTVGEITYGKTNKLDLIGWAGQMYMEDFSMAIELDSRNRGYERTEGDMRITKTESGLEFSNMNYVQYTTRNGHRVTLIHMPYLDAVNRSEQELHPRTGRPLTSHSCYYIAHGLDENGTPNVRLMSEKGEAKVVGIHRGLTNIPKSWGDIPNSELSMMQLSTERNEASIHERRSVGVNILNTENTFHHYSAF
jgi:hypothetical protein